jgi:quinol monooxygenase YgiN
MLIVAGRLEIEAGERDAYVRECEAVVRLARVAPGCLDFSITADTLDGSRVNLFECWETEAHLLEFRGSGPDSGLALRIRSASVAKYRISAVEDP